MNARRLLMLSIVAISVAGLISAVSLRARGDVAQTPSPATPAAAKATLAAQLPATPPDCSDQDDDDDDVAERNERKDRKVAPGRPDTDDVEVECGDQNDDDHEVGEDKDHHVKGVVKPAEKPEAVRKPAVAKSPVKR